MLKINRMKGSILCECFSLKRVLIFLARDTFYMHRMARIAFRWQTKCSVLFCYVCFVKIPRIKIIQLNGVNDQYLCVEPINCLHSLNRMNRSGKSKLPSTQPFIKIFCCFFLFYFFVVVLIVCNRKLWLCEKLKTFITTQTIFLIVLSSYLFFLRLLFFYQFALHFFFRMRSLFWCGFHISPEVKLARFTNSQIEMILTQKG